MLPSRPTWWEITLKLALMYQWFSATAVWFQSPHNSYSQMPVIFLHQCIPVYTYSVPAHHWVRLWTAPKLYAGATGTPSDGKCWLIGKDPDAGKDWGQEERQVTEDEMTVWHHLFNGHEFEQALGDKEGQWSLVCCCPWGRKESDMT